MQGTTEYGSEVAFQGRKAHIHKTMISASKVHSKGLVAVVDSNGGYFIHYSSTLARKIQHLVQKEIVREPAVRLYLENGTYIGHTKIQQHVSTRSDQELCSMHAKKRIGRPSAPSEGVRPMVSVGKAHSCLFAQSPEAKLQIIPIESEIVDAGIDDAANEVQRPNVVVVGRGPTKLEVEHHVASGHAQHRPWYDACMRARGIAGIHERWELVAKRCENWKVCFNLSSRE